MGKFGTGVSEQDLDQLTSLFQLLSDKTRVKILLLLAEGERNVTALCHSLGLPQPTVSHHLGLLRGRNIISNRRQGKQVHYTLNGTVHAGPGQDLLLGLENLAVRILTKP
ncbi:MAG: metalloregulator ArsR/SmtB family transcription factor [Tepidisphaeraceae bacterium]|jgi:DNA-binding transcriptional ArsR family regulator